MCLNMNLKTKNLRQTEWIVLTDEVHGIKVRAITNIKYELNLFVIEEVSLPLLTGKLNVPVTWRRL